MSAGELPVLFAILIATMLACRCLPLLLLRGRALPPRVERALGLIPTAAFTALVANDLLEPALFLDAPLDGVMTLAAALLVAVVARQTKSLVWSALSGLVAYGLLVIVL